MHTHIHIHIGTVLVPDVEVDTDFCLGRALGCLSCATIPAFHLPPKAP